ncbi:aspartate-semialdehyde dehydrogenase [Lactobacillus plantarum WCFS1] [Lactiplantibacillus mudanjiangensis]|uniref:Aspartate-semialdehyde dehydrogenase [Lactobacillus plantarum WCFS1] n=1 Tax=Lactiplantibacillus mudanjiangensis TaxID=1296538 RepID=A0A660E1N7_9LACO|nr:aspartate-semialdehyde dehydrogenase [Lactobacillus plantarum WCFS1] [Lactiplantibacillus mudanjiangensis]VDG29343.1 aspartate-semialdehyde dehydrogenase [Lactobacillus plantarum WCFS1] [Lactiplantibacillus mudanjiangensis]
MSKSYSIAILGATGAVGTRMIDQLAKSDIKVSKLCLLASKRSAGKILVFRGRHLIVSEV